MQILISGRHTQLREAEKRNFEEKVQKYKKKLPELTKLEVVLNVEHEDRHEIELILHVSHSNPLVAKATSSSNYTAMDLAIQKLDNIVSKFLDKKKDHHRAEKQAIGN
jgi:ribosomal subunit interface protein